MNTKVTLKRVQPNLLFQLWLADLYKEAAANNSKLEPMLKKAMDSLAKYPVPLQSGAECIIIQGFNKKLCRYLDICLEKYNSTFASSENCDSRHDDGAIRPDSPSSTSSSLPYNNYLPHRTSTTPTSSSNLNIDNESVDSQFSSDSLRKYPKTSSQTSDVDSCNTPVSPPNSNKAKNKSKPKVYEPAHRSGGYAILVALLEQELENPEKPSLKKEELIEKAQKHSEESFIRPKPESFYTAWSNMTRLVKKDLVKKINRKKVEYSLTEEGKELAKRILQQAKTIPTVNDHIFNNVPSNSSDFQKQNANALDNAVPSTSQNINNNNIVIEMAPGTFDIILLIDKNETGGLRKKNDPTVAQFNKYPDLKHEYRSLKVGDYTWIARHKVNQQEEIVLPFVVERKRMDDLGASIKDGRFHEQKFRLRKCGLRNVIYMVENYGKNKNVGLPVQSLMQALANTRVQDGFKVHMTDSLTNSARFLAMMTKRLTIRFKDKHLRGCNDVPSGDNLMTFEYFNKSSAKTKALTVTETFIKLLLQLKGVSVEKALAITKKYPTPRSLIHAYVKCDRKEGECLLEHLKYGDLNRNVGPVTSKSIYQLFSNSSNE